MTIKIGTDLTMKVNHEFTFQPGVTLIFSTELPALDKLSYAQRITYRRACNYCL